MLKKYVVVLDTNVFVFVFVSVSVSVSGLISPTGVPGAILRKFRQGEFEIATSASQIQEIKLVLRRPSLARALPTGTPKEVAKFFAAFKKLTTIHKPKNLTWDFKDINDHFILDLIVHRKLTFLLQATRLFTLSFSSELAQLFRQSSFWLDCNCSRFCLPGETKNPKNRTRGRSQSLQS